jgi:hypothetical protein
MEVALGPECLAHSQRNVEFGWPPLSCGYCWVKLRELHEGLKCVWKGSRCRFLQRRKPFFAFIRNCCNRTTETQMRIDSMHQDDNNEVQLAPETTMLRTEDSRLREARKSHFSPEGRNDVLLASCTFSRCSATGVASHRDDRLIKRNGN